MSARHGLFVANGSSGVTSPQDARLALAGLLTGAGIVDGLSVTGSSSGPNMKYLVHAGVVSTARGNVAVDGLYLWSNDGTVTVDSGSPAPGSGKRYDLVYALAKNANDGFGDPDSGVTFGVTVGSSGSSPTKPYGSVPAGALVLAESLVESGDADATDATITMVAAAAGVDGGILPVTDSTQYPAAPTAGQAIWDLSVNRMLVWTGSRWRTFDEDSAYYVTRTTSLTADADGVNISSYDGPSSSKGSAITFSGGIFTVQKAGLYRWSGTVVFAVTGSVVKLYVAINGNPSPFGAVTSVQPTHQMNLTAGSLLDLNNGDTVQMQAAALDSDTVCSPQCFSLETA